MHAMDSLEDLRADLFDVRHELERIQRRVEGDSDGERVSSVEEDAASLEWEPFAEYMEDQGFDEAEIAECWEELHEGYGSFGEAGEADAAEYASQEEYDTANGAEREERKHHNATSTGCRE